MTRAAQLKLHFTTTLLHGIRRDDSPFPHLWFQNGNPQRLQMGPRDVLPSDASDGPTSSLTGPMKIYRPDNPEVQRSTPTPFSRYTFSSGITVHPGSVSTLRYTFSEAFFPAFLVVVFLGVGGHSGENAFSDAVLYGRRGISQSLDRG